MKIIKAYSSQIAETPLLTTKINVINKEQYVLMMEAITPKSFNIIKYIFPAIFFFILFILTWSLAYSNAFGQIVMIISIAMFTITIAMSAKCLLERLSFIKSIPKKAEKLKCPTSFVYQFYEDRMYTKNQDLEGFFDYSSFQSIGVYKEGIQFVFRYKNSSIGSQLYTTYNVSSFWMPLSSFEEKEIQEVFAFIKGLKEAHLCQ